MGFHIGDGVLTGTAQAHIAPHLVDVPELILALDSLDPHIGQTHTQTVVEANAAVLNGQAHTGHAGHILGDGDGLGVHLADQLVGQLQVGDGLGVGVVGEVLVVGVEVGAQAVVMVQHGGNTVETETIEVVLSHPELQIGQQEVQNAGLAVVEALGAPGRMVALGAVVEELPGGAVEHVDALGGVLDGVGVDHVQQHPDAHFVGLVHQILQILGLAEPGGSGIEVGNLVAEGAVVGMLHDGHQLDGVVAGFLHMGQGVVSELPVGAHLALFLGHAHVGFVNEQGVFTLEILVGNHLLGFFNDGLVTSGLNDSTLMECQCAERACAKATTIAGKREFHFLQAWYPYLTVGSRLVVYGMPPSSKGLLHNLIKFFLTYDTCIEKFFKFL